MSRHKSLLVILSIALAVIAPLLMAIKAKSDISSYPVVKVEIEPYDPRDLMYGHYMQFRIKWNWKKDIGSCSGGACCLCVGEGDNNPEVSLTSCPAAKADKPAQCAHVLEGGHYGFSNSTSNFDIGINRYYVDEALALPLEDLFRNKKDAFQVGLSISPTGKAVLEKMYVSGKTVNEYVDGKGGKLERIPAQSETIQTP